MRRCARLTEGERRASNVVASRRTPNRLFELQKACHLWQAVETGAHQETVLAEIDYRLDDLGWFQFERMCQALLRAKYGASLEAWGGSQDFGRDAYSEGELEFPAPRKMNDGPFVFQVKFIANANVPRANLRGPLRSAVQSELSRITSRLSSGLWEVPRYYTLLTNAPLSAANRRDLRALIKEALPDTEIILLGASDIAASLDDSPSIRLSYPQILGLRDLRNLLRSAVAADVVTRSTISIDMTAQLAQVFVATDAYNKALQVLEGFGFAVLTGPPEMGKTATAWMIALARLSSGWDAYDCRSPSDMFRVYDSERHQIFVADDAFGSTEYRPEIASEWAAQLDRVVAICGPRHWVVWTSRPGPLKTGLERLHLVGASSSFPDPMRVQVNASRLSLVEKAQILYRHAKAAHLPAEAIDLIRENASIIVQSEHFTPLRIKRLITEQLPQVMRAKPSQQKSTLMMAARQGLLEPSTAMRTSFEVLPEETRIFLISMLNGSNRAVELNEIDSLRRSFSESAPDESTEKIAGLIDDHFIRVHRSGRS